VGAVFDRIRELVSLLFFILMNPSWNRTAALALYVSIGVLLLIIIVAAVMIAMGGSNRDQAEESESSSAPEPRRERRKPQPMSTRGRWAVGGGAVLALLLVWLAAGYSTSDPAACNKCHGLTSPHADVSAATDPHAKVACVLCHETGGVVGRFVTGVPLRVLHLAQASANASSATDYGQVTVKACSPCHSASLRITTTNTKRELKVSHTEPMEASATCVDCHKLQGGVVSIYNAGMNQCLRCHDGEQASTACDTCHVGKVTAAARPRAVSFQGHQIQDISCGGCHDEKRDCDPCHGMRMPHTTDFMLHSHARAAVVDFWYNDGKTCGRCHTATRRSCRCHTRLIGKAHGETPWLASSHKVAQTASCNTCHQRFAWIATRDFCKDVCHSEAAIAASPR
jgi:hypothetical protein